MRLLVLAGLAAVTAAAFGLEPTASSLSGGHFARWPRGALATPLKPPSPAPANAAPGSPATFVGAARCVECHQRTHEKWKGARHSKMLQPATPASVKGDFDRGSVELRGKRYRLRAQDGAYFISESYLAEKERERRVDFTLGSRRIQHYLTTLEDGRIVVLPPTWDVERRQWFHNLEIVDPEEAAATRVQVWNTNCYSCHVSQQDKNYDPAKRTYATRWQDFGTSCERCHGPGSLHVEGHAGGAPGPAAVMVRPARLGGERETMVCAQCHSLRDITAGGYTAGSDYYDHFMPILEYAQKVDKDPAYWPDGRPRRFSNDALGLWQSECYLKGKVSCTACHLDPHEPDIDRNPQLLPANNSLCTRCHEEAGRRLAEHTRHRADGPGSSCVECHMPKTVVSIKSRMRDHAIGIPAPENTVRFGIPNACNECHQDRSPAWAVQALRKWGLRASGEKLAGRAFAFSGGRAGDPAALERLIALASSPSEGPLTRANAIGYLRRYQDPRVLGPLLAAMKADHPLIRAVAALTVAELPIDVQAARPALIQALADPQRIVRVAAVFSLMNKGVARLPGEAGQRLERAKQEYVARAGLLTDDAETQLNLGKFHFLDGQYAKAAGAFLDTLRLRPDQPGGSYFLALARVGEGHAEEARRLLEKVGSRDPYYKPARGLLEKLKGGQRP